MEININDILAPYVDVINLETDTRIEKCVYADDVRGIYEVYRVDNEGEVIFNPGTQSFETDVKKGSIVITKKHSYIYIFFSLLRDVIQKFIKFVRLTRPI